MSVLEGSLGILPRRILVDDDRCGDDARRLLEDAGLGNELARCRRSRRKSPTMPCSAAGCCSQPRRGHRVGHDAILLAAAPGARAAIGLSISVRAWVPQGLRSRARVDGTQRHVGRTRSRACRAGAENAQRNGLAARVRAVVLDVAAPARAFAAAGLAPETRA